MLACSLARAPLALAMQAPDGGGGGGGGGAVIFVLLLPLLFFFAVIWLFATIARGIMGTFFGQGGPRQDPFAGPSGTSQLDEPGRFADVRQTVEEDLDLLANDILVLDDLVRAPDAPLQAQRRYDAAAASYRTARARLDRATRLEHLTELANRVADARYHMAAAEALLEGRPLPERREPCFFDPNHGPSARDVPFELPTGDTRMVPACERCARLVAEHHTPEPRHVLVRGHDTPYWNAPGYYTTYYGGFFGPGMIGGIGAGGLLGGFVLSGLLGGDAFRSVGDPEPRGQGRSRRR